MADEWWKISRGTDDDVFPAVPPRLPTGEMVPEEAESTATAPTTLPQVEPQLHEEQAPIADNSFPLSPEPKTTSQPEPAFPQSAGMVPAGTPSDSTDDEGTTLAATIKEPAAPGGVPKTTSTVSETTPDARGTSSKPSPGAQHDRDGLAKLMRLGGLAAVAPQRSVALLIVVDTPQPVRIGQVITLKNSRCLLGRARQCACILDDPAVADFHAVLTHEQHDDFSGYYIYSACERALNVNAARVEAPVRLSAGDRIVLGNSELVFFEATLRRSAS